MEMVQMLESLDNTDYEYEKDSLYDYPFFLQIRKTFLLIAYQFSLKLLHTS